MAEHGTVEYSTASGNDLAAHEQTFKDFLKLVKWSVIFIAITLILMAYFLV